MKFQNKSRVILKVLQKKKNAAELDRELFSQILFVDIAYPVNISYRLLKHVQQQSQLCRGFTTCLNVRRACGCEFVSV